MLEESEKTGGEGEQFGRCGRLKRLLLLGR
jgi:hypothetical protein